MIQLTHLIENASSGISPHIVCESFIEVCGGRFALEKDTRKARLWGAMTTSLKRAKKRWEATGGQGGDEECEDASNAEEQSVDGGPQ